MKGIVMQRRTFVACSVLIAACTAPDDALPTEEDDLVSPDDKSDTGYFSDAAAELEGELVGRIELDVTGRSEAERQAMVAGFRARMQAQRNIIEAQVRLTKPALSRLDLQVNLNADDVVIGDVGIAGDVLHAEYTVATEALVRYSDLAARGVNPMELLDRSYSIPVAKDPDNLLARYGVACASGFHAGELDAWNYFYYFDATKPGCTVPTTTATYTVRALAPKSDTYPEFDRLTADGRVEAAVIFGVLDPSAPAEHDNSTTEWRRFVETMQARQFVGSPLSTVGTRFTREREGLVEIIDVISPLDLEALGSANTPAVFADLLRHHEILVYNGHSFYGSLSVLNDPANYPANTYQIIMMNSCWSYAYYTKQVFAAKATASDPRGWANADVINNSEKGWSYDMEATTRQVLTNLFAGAEVHGAGNGRRYTWQAIITALNGTAQHNHDLYGSPDTHAELYGAAGVKDNAFTP